VYLPLEGSKNTSVTQKQMSSQREQYGSTVHLFIGMGRSPCKITFRPFAFDNNSIAVGPMLRRRRSSRKKRLSAEAVSIRWPKVSLHKASVLQTDLKIE
jgi:hypothetical protein